MPSLLHPVRLKPIRDEDTARAFHGQCSERTTRRWRQRLARYGYITQKRTPVGYVIRVMKSKKWAHLESPNRKVNGQKWPVRSARNGQSEVPNVAGEIGHDRQFRTTDHGRSNKDSAVQGKDSAVDAAAIRGLPANSPLWKLVGLNPETLPAEFVRLSENLFLAKNGQSLMEFVGVCMDSWQVLGNKIPRSFARAASALRERQRIEPQPKPLEFLPELPFKAKGAQCPAQN